MTPSRLARDAVFALVFAGWGCHSSTLTYYHDVQPIIEAKCQGCHTAGGIGPFSFGTAEDVISNKTLIRAAVADRVMPPWPPSDTCNSYKEDRSLSDAQIQTITDWIDQGAAVGDEATAVSAPSAVGMTRVDFTMEMAQPFTPLESPDDYRCFLINWPETTEKFVTGLGVRPGDAQIVHHAIVYIAAPADTAMYQAMDGTDGHPGWTCFGGPGGEAFGSAKGAQWLGAWAPGAVGTDFPAGTGVGVEPGSMIILQVHYNTEVNPPAPDQTTIDIEVEDSVTKPAYVLPFVDPAWILGGMDIPANSPDTVHEYTTDPTPNMSKETKGLIADSTPFTLYMSFLHMHTRGSAITGQIDRQDGGTTCLLDIPAWSFSWQGGYTFAQPFVFNPGDQLDLACHWNNTASNQPVIDGVQEAPHDLNWGETTEEEMCLEILYMTQ